MTISALIVDANDGLSVCCEASGGVEALAILEDQEPTVIVLDEMMPGMSGLETAAEILRRNLGQRILMFSAFLDRELEGLAALCGITACLTKDRVMEIPAVLRALV